MDFIGEILTGKIVCAILTRYLLIVNNCFMCDV